MTTNESLPENRLLHPMNLPTQSTRADEHEALNLDPLVIPTMIAPLQTPDADGGLNYHALHTNDSGLVVQILLYPGMSAGDKIEVFWGDADVPAASTVVLQQHVGKDVEMFVAEPRVLEGLHSVHYTITRAGSGNEEDSPPLRMLVRREQPGGTDPEPDRPNHQGLLPPEPELPASGVIDEDAARNGIKVTIPPYPNMRQFDRITLSWGGEFVYREVTPGEVGQPVEIVVREETILKAGDSQSLVLVYRIKDEVDNISSDWSMRTFVDVEVDPDSPAAPAIINPDANADPYDVIDLEKLGDSNLTVVANVPGDQGIAAGDFVRLEWTGRTLPGQEIVFRSDPQRLPQVPWPMLFEVPNGHLLGLGKGSGTASYRALLADGSEISSRRAFVNFIGAELQLPKPTVSEAVGNSLDPDLPQATVVVPGGIVEAGDWVVMTWMGIQASGDPLRHSEGRSVSAAGAGQAMKFDVLADFIKPLEGGRVEVYYEIQREGLDVPLLSEHEHLQVGETQSALPAPEVNPAASNGWLDPDTLPNGVTVVIKPYANMRAGQTLYMEWRSSVGQDIFDSMPIGSPLVGKPVQFPINQEQLQGNLNGDVEVWYRVEEPGQPARRSEPLHLKIGKEQEEEAPLTEPVVLEAVDGKLDPAWAPNGATVRVSYPGMLPSDILAISVLGNGPEGSHDSEQQNGSAAGFVDFIVPASVIAANLGHSVRVLYARVRNGVPELSLPLTLSVQEVPPEGLPTPVIPQVVEGLLDLQDFNGDAQVTVEPWPEIAVGQHYWLRAHGTKKDGSEHVIELALAKALSAAEVSMGLNVFLLRDELLKLLNYSELNVELKVALHGGREEVGATLFPRLKVLVRPEHRLLFENFDHQTSKVIYFGETMETPTMVISLLVPNEASAAYYPVFDNHRPPGMSGNYLSVPHIARGEQRVRLDLKTPCRRVVFTCTEVNAAGSTLDLYLYNAQGVELWRKKFEKGEAKGVQIDFKAPVGMYVSRIEAEAETRCGFDNFTFEV